MSGWPRSPIRCAPRAPSTASPPTPTTSSSRASRTAVGSSQSAPRAEKAHDSVRRVSHPRSRKSLLRPLREALRVARPGGVPFASASAAYLPAPSPDDRSLARPQEQLPTNVDGDPSAPASAGHRVAPTPPSTMWTAACAMIRCIELRACSDHYTRTKTKKGVDSRQPVRQFYSTSLSPRGNASEQRGSNTSENRHRSFPNATRDTGRSPVRC